MKDLLPTLFDMEPETDPVWGDRWIKRDQATANQKPFGRQHLPTDQAPQVFDVDEAITARDTAIQHVDEAANPDWKELYYSVLERLAQRMETFTADDIWEEIERLENVPPQPERRAAGPVVLRAVKNGLIKLRPNYLVPSRRAHCHRTPIRVYESLIFKHAA